MERRNPFWRAVAICVLILALTGWASAQYAGGTGTLDDPYWIASPQDLVDLGSTPEDYSKHFVLTADIDLSDHSFDRAVIAPDAHRSSRTYQGEPFSGVFDGNGHVIAHLHIKGKGSLGLFGHLGRGAIVRDLGLEDVSIEGAGYDEAGAVAGYNSGSLLNCYCTGTMTGDSTLGGMVGCNAGNLSHCYSTVGVAGRYGVGGLIGRNRYGTIVSRCYSAGSVTADDCYAGGLIGDNSGGLVTRCLWDVEASGAVRSSGGAGLATTQMKDPKWISLQGWANDPNWVLDSHQDYPRLAWEGTPGQIVPEPDVDWMEGSGTSDIPYEIDDPSQLLTISKASLMWEMNFILAGDLDLAEIVWSRAVIPDFTGTFDGKGHTIKHLRISGDDRLGLLGRLGVEGAILNLDLVDVDIVGTGSTIGGLIGENNGSVLNCCSEGAVTGNFYVGGLVGENAGCVSSCYSEAEIMAHGSGVGGVIGDNSGMVSNCYCTEKVTGEGGGTRVYGVGGLVGDNSGSVSNCYSTGAVAGRTCIGGLVGHNSGSVSHCLTSGAVSGDDNIGGFVAENSGSVVGCFWDTEASGLTASAAGAGLGTAEMRAIQTYLDSGWDFVDESGSGTADFWQMPQAGGYPALSLFEGYEPVLPNGQGTPAQPFLITNALELGSVGYRPFACYCLEADLDFADIA